MVVALPQNQSVSLFKMFNALSKFDANGDEKFSRAEIAKAALELNNRSLSGAPDVSRALATLVLGGADGKGVVTDSISIGQLATLASPGNADALEGSDLAAKYPTNFAPDSGIDTELSQKIVGDLNNIVNPPATNPTSQDPLDQILQVVLMLFQSLLGNSPFAGLFGNLLGGLSGSNAKTKSEILDVPKPQLTF